jgi:hypothetical protein
MKVTSLLRANEFQINFALDDFAATHHYRSLKFMRVLGSVDILMLNC